tara:strand:+ start:120 stop:641 length:522 start_codon:yes stop_codon:yes gene_type:complete
MLTKSNYFNLINAANIASDLFGNGYVASIDQFQDFKNINLGLPILLQADRDVFDFSEDNTFIIPENSLLKTIYNLTDRDYVGFNHSFKTNKFVSSFTVKEKHKKLFQSIVTQNSETLDTIKKLKQRWHRVGAFQTRNIPHRGHEKIIQKMLLDCDHVVINPVIGPKKNRRCKY